MLNKELFYETIKSFDINVDESAFNRLDKFAEMLIETNKSFNLTAIKEPDDVTVKHFADCLSIFKYVDIPEGAKIIDVGTGAGFPGLVIAAAYPEIQVTLLDSTGKKLKAVQDMAEKMGVTNAEIVHMRAEDAGKNPDFREKYDFATARAVAELKVLSEYTLPFVKKGGSFLSLKGATAIEEISTGEKAVQILGGKIEGVDEFSLPGGDKRAIIKVKKISQTSAKYPRPSAQIAKKPL